MEKYIFAWLFWLLPDISKDPQVPSVAAAFQALSDWQSQSKIYTNSVIVLYLLKGL